MICKHHILTRFNIGLYSNPDRPRNIEADSWMEHRLSLFEKFTLPSIMNQSCQNFSWILLVDEQTPEKFIRRIEDLNYSNIKICFTCVDLFSINDYSNAQVWEINTYDHSNFDIITTRIDNDDAFHVDYIKEIQTKYIELVNKSKPFVISFPLGYILDSKSNQIVIYKYSINNCPSLVTSCNRQDFKTVFCCAHGAICRKYKTFYIQESEPFWLNVIHPQNVSGRARRHFNKLQKVKQAEAIFLKFGIESEYCYE